MAALWLPLAAAVVFRSEWIAVHLLGDVRTRLGLLLLPPVMLLTGVENLQKQQFYGIGSMRLPAGVELGAGAALGVHYPASGRSGPGTAGSKPPRCCAPDCCSASSFPPASSPPPDCIAPPQLRRSARSPGTAAPPPVCHRPAGELYCAGGQPDGRGDLGADPQLLVRHGLSAEQAMEEFGILMGMTLPLLMIPTAFVNALSLALLPRLTRERSLGQMGAFRRTGEKAMLAVCYVVLPLIA